MCDLYCQVNTLLRSMVYADHYSSIYGEVTGFYSSAARALLVSMLFNESVKN